MSEQSIDRAALQRATQQIEAKHQQIHALQTRLQSQMAELTVRWRDNTSTAFQHRYRQFDTEFEKVKQGLDMIHGQLVDALRECGGRVHGRQIASLIS